VTHEAHRVCEFAFPGPLRDRLVGAVLRGEKTATSSLLVEWQLDGEPVPAAGERQTVIDSDGRPVGVIEMHSVEVIRLGDADLRLAVAEGEGFETVAQWREEHECFWTDEVLPALPADIAAPLADDTQVVVQWFRLAAES
jgi:uncharacterized protein YhfF